MSNVDEICLMHEKVLRQQVRKQTLEEVLKDDFDEEGLPLLTTYGRAYIKQKLRETG